LLADDIVYFEMRPPLSCAKPDAPLDEMKRQYWQLLIEAREAQARHEYYTEQAERAVKPKMKPQRPMNEIVRELHKLEALKHPLRYQKQRICALKRTIKKRQQEQDNATNIEN